MRTWALLLLGLLTPSTVLALGPGEASLSGGGGLAVSHAGQTRVGTQMEMRLVRGITDAWAGRLSLRAEWYPGRDATGAIYAASQSLGMTWAADVLDWVPFVDLGVVLAYAQHRGTGSSARLGGQLGVGIDYFLSRYSMLTLLARGDYLALGLAGEEGLRAATFALGLYFGRVF
jgi:hypothetical protein